MSENTSPLAEAPARKAEIVRNYVAEQEAEREPVRPLTDHPGVDVRNIDTMDMDALFELLPPQHIADCFSLWLSKQEAELERHRLMSADDE